MGRFDLTAYLDRVVFHARRRFEREEFRSFMFAQSFPHAPVIALARELKQRHALRAVALSNEGRELAQHRIQAFNLGAFTDFFVVSSFVHCRKPDAEIYRMALDIAQVTPEHGFFKMAALIGPDALGNEFFSLVRGTLGPDLDADGREQDLFDGVE